MKEALENLLIGTVVAVSLLLLGLSFALADHIGLDSRWVEFGFWTVVLLLAGFYLAHDWNGMEKVKDLYWRLFRIIFFVHVIVIGSVYYYYPSGFTLRVSLITVLSELACLFHIYYSFQSYVVTCHTLSVSGFIGFLFSRDRYGNRD